MTRLICSSFWHAFLGRLKKKFGRLLRNQTLYSSGLHEEMLGRMQRKLGLRAVYARIPGRRR